MGFLDTINKIITPYDDEDEDFDGAVKTEQEPETPAAQAQMEFERTFAGNTANEYIDGEEEIEEPAAPSGGLFGALSKFRREKDVVPVSKVSTSRCAVSVDGDSGVLQFMPTTFEEAGELVDYLLEGKTIYLSLEQVELDKARRLLDFMTGITYALQGKVQQVSNKAYFITPRK